MKGRNLVKNEPKIVSGGSQRQGIFKNSKKNAPLVSVITVVFNGERYIEETILSVINQTYSNVEYIIIDGGSTDKTLDIIRKYDSTIDCWISEKDEGVYNAMNKGIDISRGEWLYFIGADDYFLVNKSLEDIPFADLSMYLAISGGVVYEGAKYVISSFSNKMFLHNTLHHQATFYSKKLFLAFQYDEEFKIVADYELNLILFLHHRKKVKFIKNIICFCRLDGLSLKYANEAHKEMNKVRRKHFCFFNNILLGTLLWVKVMLLSIYKKIGYK